MNEWILVKGCIEVVSSNSMSTGNCDYETLDKVNR